MENATESDLLQQAHDGDAAAFAALAARHVDAVYDFALVITGDARIAREVAAVTFERAATGVRGSPPEVGMRSWLLGIARSALLPARRGTARPPESTSMSIDPSLLPIGSSAAAASSVAPAVLNAARGLGPQQHALLDLRLRQGLDFEAAAAAGHIPEASMHQLAGRLDELAESRMQVAVLRPLCPALAECLGEAAPPERSVVAEHIAGCAGCREQLGTLPALLDVYAAIPRVAAPPETRAIVLGRLMRRWNLAANYLQTAALAAAGAASAGGPPVRRSRVLFAFGPLCVIATALAALLFYPESPISITRARDVPAAPTTALAGIDTPVAAPTRSAPTDVPARATATPTPPGAVTQPAVVPTSTVRATSTPSSLPLQPATAVTSQPVVVATSTPSASATAPSPTPTPAATSATVTGTATATPTPAPGECAGSLQANFAEVTAFPRVLTSFVIFNTSECTEATFSIDPPSVSWLQVTSPRTGTVAPLRSTSVTFIADPLTPSQTSLHIDSPTGGFTVVIVAK